MAGNVLSNWRPARIGSTDFCILNVVSDGSPKAAASVACRELVLQHFSRVLKYGPPVSMFCFEVSERLSCSTTSFSSSWSLCKPAQLARLLTYLLAKFLSSFVTYGLRRTDPTAFAGTFSSSGGSSSGTMVFSGRSKQGLHLMSPRGVGPGVGTRGC